MVDMQRLKTSEAAALLNVSPNTLRAWERRFGFPQPQRSPGRHRLYTPGDVAALRDALQEGLSVSSAVSRAREGMSADATSLVGALVSYDAQRADFAMDATLALRSVERSVAQVLLPGLDEIVRAKGRDSAAWAFAARWATDWLQRATRSAPPPMRPVSVVLGDASQGELDPDAPHIRALELFCVRASVKVLTLSVRGIAGIRDAISRHPLDLVIVAGSHVDDETVARWAYAIRVAIGRFPIAAYRPARERGARHMVLPAGALDARRHVLKLLKGQQSTRRQPGFAAEPHPSIPTTVASAAG
jgi:hypothetical protein